MWLRRPTKQGVMDCTAPALEQVEGSNPSVRVSRRRVRLTYFIINIKIYTLVTEFGRRLVGLGSGY